MPPAVVRCAEVGDRRLLALSFDDGPGDWTEAILDLLERHDARATFFVLGRQIAGREATLRRALAGRHEVGNHTWSHVRADALSETELRRELERTSEAVRAATGVDCILARPPYGADAERFAAVAKRIGLAPTVLWSVDPEDWRESSSAAIVRSVLEDAHPGAIVDLHDGWGRTPQSRQPSVEALGELVPALVSRGYALVTVSELLAA